MELVGPALEHAHHAGAIYVAVVGRRVCGNHLDLLQRLRRRAVGDQVVIGFVHVDAVQRVVVRLGAVAVHVGRIGVIGAAFKTRRAGCSRCIHCTGDIQGEG